MSTPPSQPPSPAEHGQVWQPPAARALRLDLYKTPPMLTKPWVRVDGHRFKAQWGAIDIQVPADRPCHVEAYMPFIGGSTGTAVGGFVLYPEHPPYLEYSAPYHAWFSGQMGPPGTTQHNGKGPAILLMFVAVCVLLGFAGIAILAAVLG